VTLESLDQPIWGFLELNIFFKYLQKANLIFIFNEPIQVGPQRRNKRENYAIDIHSTRNEINKK
jgi:hypothetical protein